jgi:DinB family protein
MDRGYASQIQRCEAQLRDFFSEVLSGVSGDLTRRAVADKWAPQESLAHLARYNEVFLERMHRILSENNPALPRYRAEEDPEWERWRQLSYRDLMERFAELREQLVDELKLLSDEDFERVGVHPRFGELSLSQWLEFFLVHEGHHLYLIFQQVRTLFTRAEK